MGTGEGPLPSSFFYKKFILFFFCYFFSWRCTIISDLDFDFERVLKLQQLLFFRPRTQALSKSSFFIQVLHILTKNLQSPGTVSFTVPGNQPAKICPKAN